MKSFKLFVENKNHELASKDVHKIIQYSDKLQGIIQPEDDLEDWVKAKLTHAEDYINTVLDYLLFYKPDNKNEEAKMALGDLRSIHDKANKIKDLLGKKELKDWVKAKLNLAGEYLDDVYHHLDAPK